MTETSTDQSLIQTIRAGHNSDGKAKIADLGSWFLLFVVGLGALYMAGKFIKDEFLNKEFELEVRLIGNKAKPGDQVKIDPLNQTLELDSENKLIYVAEFDMLKNKELKLTLIPKKGNQEMITAFYVREPSEKILLICHYQTK